MSKNAPLSRRFLKKRLMDCLRHTTTDRRFCSTAPTRIIPKTGRPSSTALSARSGTPEGSACTRATSICSRTSSKLQRVRAHRRRGRRCRTARRSRPDASRAPGAAPLHQSRPERPARWRAVAVWRPTAVPVGAIWASESFTITGLIGKNSSRRFPPSWRSTQNVIEGRSRETRSRASDIPSILPKNLLPGRPPLSTAPTSRRRIPGSSMPRPWPPTSPSFTTRGAPP